MLKTTNACSSNARTLGCWAPAAQILSYCVILWSKWKPIKYCVVTYHLCVFHQCGSKGYTHLFGSQSTVPRYTFHGNIICHSRVFLVRCVNAQFKPLRGTPEVRVSVTPDV
eukprot:1031649-Prorocentrum_minimum.AAC.4